MRPLVSGRGTFEQILANIHTAADLFDVAIRMNVDRANVESAEELVAILRAEGLAGRVRVYLGHLVGIDGGSTAPSTAYGPSCLSTLEFAQEELALNDLAARYGFPQTP